MVWLPSVMTAGRVTVTPPPPPAGMTAGVAIPASVPESSVPLALSSRYRSDSPGRYPDAVPVTDAPGLTRVVDRAKLGVATLTGLLFTLSSPHHVVPSNGVTE